MFSISKIVFSDKFQNAEIDLKKINIIVGPNNVGKSTVLKEIERWFGNWRSPHLKLLKDVKISFSDSTKEYQQFEKDILDFEDGDRTEEGENQLLYLYKQHIFDQSGTHQHQYNLKQITHEFEIQNVEYFREHFFRYFVIRLDGRNRFEAVKSQPFAIFRTSKTSKNYLTRLWLNDEDRNALEAIVYDGLGWYPCLEKNFQNTAEYINIYLTKNRPIKNHCQIQENGSGSLKDMIPIDEFGDGVNCLVGICLSILSYPYRIVLLDEPEVYLHPPIAYSLGKNLSHLIEKKYGSFVVATHSPEFLMGCLQSVPSSEISIIRLTYQDELGTVSRLEGNEILTYYTDSFLKSSEVLNALFYSSAIVAESWDDKVIYREVNDRLLESGRGINDAVFLNTNGRDSVHRITKPLRKAGIPAAAIYDLDVLEDKNLFKTILSSSKIESTMIESLETERKCIKSEIDTLNNKKRQGEENYFKNLPIDKIPVKLREAISELLCYLKTYGIFVVPIGELEQWLGNIDYNEPDKPFLKMLNKIKKTEPTTDDIWQFIDDLNIWTSNPERKGMN